MLARQAFDWGALAGMLWMLGAYAAHWFVTPMSHPHAGFLATGSAAAELVIGFGGGVWLYLRRRPAEQRNAEHGPAIL
ncbi:MAG TPA: hypothetical protein VHB25_01655 [Gemmatimonadaceae bacterium]|nr:hypothetical protein [Gemmatimonadaceae bacterium]